MPKKSNTLSDTTLKMVGKVKEEAIQDPEPPTPAVLPKPAKKPISTLPNQAYTKRKDFVGTGFQNAYQI
jgi:hypothetical protein